jgi:hypothetical protein
MQHQHENKKGRSRWLQNQPNMIITDLDVDRIKLETGTNLEANTCDSTFQRIKSQQAERRNQNLDTSYKNPPLPKGVR